MGWCPAYRARVAFPADRDKANASACSVERVADGCRIPAAAALCCGDAIRVESVRDCRQALAGFSLALIRSIACGDMLRGRPRRTPARAWPRAPPRSVASAAAARRG